MNTFLTILTAGILTDNIVLSRLLGFSESTEETTLLSAVKRSGILTVLMLLSTAVTYPIIKWVLIPLGIDYLSTLISILVICGILALSFVLSKKFSPRILGILDENRSILTCSSAVLGVCLLNFQNDYITGYLSALLYAIAAGVGFMLVSVILGAIRDRLKTADIAEWVSGLPITLLTASLLSLAFGGFSGI